MRIIGLKRAFSPYICPHNSNVEKIYGVWHISPRSTKFGLLIQEVRKKSSAWFSRKYSKTSKNGPKRPKMGVFGVSRDNFSKIRFFPDVWIPSRDGEFKVLSHMSELEKSIDAISRSQKIRFLQQYSLKTCNPSVFNSLIENRKRFPIKESQPSLQEDCIYGRRVENVMCFQRYGSHRHLFRDFGWENWSQICEIALKSAKMAKIKNFLFSRFSTQIDKN